MTNHDEPRTFTTGAVGPPGQRVFYLQVQYDDAVTAVKIEKQQVLALAEYLGGLLNDLPPAPDVGPAPDLVEPVEPEWTVGTIGVAYDNDRDRIVIVAEELVAEEDEPGDVLRVAVTREQVRALIERAEELMLGGRPPCRLCGAPIDPSGHACPRAN